MDGNHELRFQRIVRTLNKVNNQEKSIVIFHASNHNPTGIDFSKDQWKQLKMICYHRRILPLFDMVFEESSRVFIEKPTIFI